METEFHAYELQMLNYDDDYNNISNTNTNNNNKYYMYYHITKLK